MENLNATCFLSMAVTWFFIPTTNVVPLSFTHICPVTEIEILDNLKLDVRPILDMFSITKDFTWGGVMFTLRNEFQYYSNNNNIIIMFFIINSYLFWHQIMGIGKKQIYRPHLKAKTLGYDGLACPIGLPQIWFAHLHS